MRSYFALSVGVSYLLIGSIFADEKAAPADTLASKAVAYEISEAPEGYRRPKDWKPNRFPMTLPEIAKKHSQETMARAREQMRKVDAVNATGKYRATGASLDRHQCPEWFIDAKLGIFVDWGPWSIASWCPYVRGERLYPDWYELRCRSDYTGSVSAAEYHKKNWGVDFTSDDLLGLFKGEKFDATALMDIFKRAGARYVVPFLKHHSGFCLWDCSYTFRDTVDMAAKRDFAKEMADACRARGLKFGFYDSQCGEWEYPILQEDGSIRDYSPDWEGKSSGKIAVKDFVRDYIVPQATEFIDRYDPDIFWGDYDWMSGAATNGSYDIAAYLYNRAEGRKEVAVNDRYGNGTDADIAGHFPKGYKWRWLRTVRGDFYTDESGDTADRLDPAKWHPWEECTGISLAYGNHWQANNPESVLSERDFIILFADIVARGGNLLLLVNLDPQGAIPDVQCERLLQIGQWLARNGEAIFSTRIDAPFVTDAVDYTRSKDGSTRYFIVKKPSARISLACDLPDEAEVVVVADSEKLKLDRSKGVVEVLLPKHLAESKLPFALRCRIK